ncbi:MAG: hypothetical protein E3J56_04815 [Candidatus Aminicenantes bacterium]|nr:MAG: hypothetical protein E3J56_04815 [Candidatus Aminicenantes bacterium]
MDLGFLSIAIGIFLGLVSIGIGSFFGLKAFRTDISTKLSEINDKVIAIHGTLEKSWDLILNTLPQLTQKGGTIKIQLSNLGKTTIEAKPGGKLTKYIINVERPVLSDGLIAKLTQETGFEKIEKQLFEQVPTISTVLSTKLIMRVYSTDPKTCTEYIILFLKWLDSTYVNSLYKIKEYEEPILNEFSKNK